jgi:hypothetical protein
MPTKKRTKAPAVRRAPPSDRAAIDVALITAKRAARHYKGIVGIDYGRVYKNDEHTGEIGIRFHVAHKTGRRWLEPEQHLPKAIAGFRVDVIESGFRPHAVDPLSPAPVMQPGLCIGNIPRGSNGTLGCLIGDSFDRSLGILSNWHVLCGGTDATVGDAISQPGPGYIPNPRPVASLRRWIAPPAGYDAAIATLPPGAPVEDMLVNSSIKLTGVAEPQPGMRVLKTGIGSGVTNAIVDSIAGSFLVPYGELGGASFWMVGFRLVHDPAFPNPQVSVPGDSGAVWVDPASGLAVGLNFGGEDDSTPLSEFALAHPMPEVCTRLGVEVITNR